MENQQHSIVLYQADSTNVCVSVCYANETFWLTQKAMAELFGCSSDNISLHLKKIYAEKELEEISTTEFFSVVQKEGTRDVSRQIKFFNLDAIIAVGYRVNSKQATALNRLVTMFIDYAELMAEDEVLMSMKDWLDQTNVFLTNNRRNILEGKGTVSHEQALDKATKEYDVFRVRQDKEYISEFDKEMEKYLKGE